MKAKVEVVSENTIETAPSIIITIEDRKYLIGCGENFQRSLIENKIKLGIESLRCIVIPSQKWNSMSGVFGFLSKHADSGAKKITIAGCVGLNKIVSLSRYFFHAKDLELDIVEGSERCLFQDELVCIVGIECSSKEESSLFVACHIRQPKRKINKEKIRLLGIKSGPIIGRLLKGETIDSNGLIVNPDDVLEKQKKGVVVSYIELHSKKTLFSLLEQKNIKQYQKGGEYETSVVYHFISTEVYEDEKYKQFVSFFGQDCQHLFFDLEKKEEIVYKDSFKLQCRFSEQDNSLFQIPFNKNKETVSPCLLNGRMIRKETVVGLEPKMFIEEQNIEKINKQNQHGVLLIKSTISFLGTGAAIPSKYRNVTGIHLNIKDYGGVIFDCGEGTLGQINRLFGIESQFFEELKAIFISHKHSDHHLGLISILERKMNCKNNKIAVFAHDEIIGWIKELFGDWEIPIESVCFKNVFDFTNRPAELNSFVDVKAVEVDHTGENPLGFVLVNSREQWSVGYSGDTRPCKRFVEMLLSIKETRLILIHDSTFEESQQERAVLTKHSTIKEAFNIFKQTKAMFCIFTHLSQRYSDTALPVEIKGDLDFKNRFVFAFDFMTLDIERILSWKIDFFDMHQKLKKIFKERKG